MNLYHFQVIVKTKSLLKLIGNKDSVLFDISDNTFHVDGELVSESCRGKFKKSFLAKELSFLKGVLDHVVDQPITLTYMVRGNFKISELVI